MRAFAILLPLVFSVQGVIGADKSPSNQEAKVLFRATFDSGPDADLAEGDGLIHTAKSLKRQETRPGLHSTGVRWDKSNGRSGGALQFTNKTDQLTYFKGGKNLPYKSSEFEGSVSLWMKLSPKEDLPKGYVDPLQITDKKWNDASFFIDFDQSKERPFRLGVFSDFSFWNPDKREFDDIPSKERPMVSVAKWPFDRSKWTHVLFTWEKFNDANPGVARLYLDGKLQGALEGKQRFSWKPEDAVIMLGINYVGWIDDLVIVDRALKPDEIGKLLKD